jgi:hypothetical protein
MGFPMTAECEVVEMKAPEVFFRAQGRQMNYRSRFVFEPALSGTKISDKGTVTMHGLWKLLAPLVKAEANREVVTEHQRLKAAIEADHRLGPGPFSAYRRS